MGNAVNNTVVNSGVLNNNYNLAIFVNNYIDGFFIVVFIFLR